MVYLRKCCCCFAPKTGTVVLGCVGIILSVLAMVPHILILDNHRHYIGEYVKEQRSVGGKSARVTSASVHFNTVISARDITEEDIPGLEYASRLVWSTLVSVEVLATFCSILLIAGVVCERRYFLVPWLVGDFCLNIFALVLVLAFMFSFSNDFSLVIFFAAGMNTNSYANDLCASKIFFQLPSSASHPTFGSSSIRPKVG